MTRVLLSLLLLLLSLPLPAETTSPVATVALLTGAAHRIPVQGGPSHPLHEGALLYEGDRIQVLERSLVILRFTDDLRLSLRPGTDLTIRRYLPTGDQHLELTAGSVRVVTGTGAHAAPDRFRLATPIAAIGVRGTDFSARFSDQSLYAQLHAGAILIAPRAHCGDLLPAHCPTARPIDVPGDLWRITPTGELLPVLDALANALLTRSSVPPVSASTLARPDVTLPERERPLLRSDPPSPHPLVWGYWAFLPAPRLPHDTLSLPAAQAAADGRRIAIGMGAYGIWRAGPDSLDPFLTGLVRYHLTDAIVGFTTSEFLPSAPAHLQDPHLVIDFDRALLTTAYTLQTLDGRLLPYRTDLPIRPNATFTHEDGLHRLSGALTSDGRFVAFQFIHPFAEGQFEGITRWSR
ncbi:MAG: FecR domain-containing protein [Hydrogenophilus sp.]|nr:FecR domain-containing protein [Hydrogenophilus sp.]